MVIRYNVPKWGGPRPLPDAGPAVSAGTAGECRTPPSARENRHFGYGFASVLLHAAAIGVLVLAVSPPLWRQLRQNRRRLSWYSSSQHRCRRLSRHRRFPRLKHLRSLRRRRQHLSPSLLNPFRHHPSHPSADAGAAAASTRSITTAATAAAKAAGVAPSATKASGEGPGRKVAISPDAGCHSGSTVSASGSTGGGDGSGLGDRGLRMARRTSDLPGAGTGARRGGQRLGSLHGRSFRSVVQAVILKPSGSSLLDDAALGLLRQAAFPPFPANMPQAQVTITTSIRYSLR